MLILYLFFFLSFVLPHGEKVERRLAVEARALTYWLS